VVVDEVLGQWVTLAVAPGLDGRYWLAGFALFR
jgi:phosphatidylglycerophosphatase A